jgi:hypothetical protein
MPARVGNSTDLVKARARGHGRARAGGRNPNAFRNEGEQRLAQTLEASGASPRLLAHQLPKNVKKPSVSAKTRQLADQLKSLQMGLRPPPPRPQNSAPFGPVPGVVGPPTFPTPFVDPGNRLINPSLQNPLPQNPRLAGANSDSLLRNVADQNSGLRRGSLRNAPTFLEQLQAQRLGDLVASRREVLAQQIGGPL